MSASIHRSSIFPSRRKDTIRDFATMGASKLAYVRIARSEDVALFCPEAPALAPGQNVFVLCAANGTPILVTDTRESAIANAEHEKLEAVSLH
ncbi:DUF1150 family protein [Pseudorhodoplanes sinuspersici]|uniref:Uncharacterized protein n=1 Tax=Pseudorhodoplanes sinuspersici TaxID=1235591 RepID=A0A1W6ZQK8_9HYPH|nr:DUF1150 domain-containing protein [Pseudorhodoplanes sinuspersici]ARP99527.1 hypothetical protein CAK95_10860 [Pseudorhodoplanes sinuspersici]RKE70489.1 hypothetical protein DFP91_2720 [Pseudorhodoplanes sinuspersici]